MIQYHVASLEKAAEQACEASSKPPFIFQLPPEEGRKVLDKAQVRDEGEAYAKKLMEANVDVACIRFNGIIHDFVMLNALDQTNATRTAMDVSCDWIYRKNAFTP